MIYSESVSNQDIKDQLTKVEKLLELKLATNTEIMKAIHAVIKRMDVLELAFKELQAQLYIYNNEQIIFREDKMTKKKDEAKGDKKPIVTKSQIHDKTVIECIGVGFDRFETKLMNYFDRLDKKFEKFMFYAAIISGIMILAAIAYILCFG